MEVRLNKMEMTVSVCRFYDLFFYHNQFSHHHPHSVFMDYCNTRGVQQDGGTNQNSVHFLSRSSCVRFFNQHYLYLYMSKCALACVDLCSRSMWVFSASDSSVLVCE